MKKIFVSLIVTFLLFIPLGVNAESNIVLKCNKTEIIADETLTCDISSSVDEGIVYNKLEASLNVSGATSITFNGDSTITGNITDNKLVLNSSNNLSNSDIGSIQIKFSNVTTGSKKINLSNVKFYNDNNQVATVNNVDSIIKVKSTVNTLESLTVSECNHCSLSPSFKSAITFYVVNAKSNKIMINAKANGNATVTGTGLKTLTKDEETFQITVTSEAGTTKNYKIKVNKEALGDTSLKSLTIDQGKLTPSFSNSVTSYDATVDSDKIVIKATANDSSSKVTGTGEKQLEYGRNEFTIIVTASDGSTKSYLININRTDTRNANAYLKEIKINGKDIDFEKDIVEYVYNVGKDIDSLEIEAIPELESSKVEIEGNENFQLGENTVTITVKAEDDSEKVYKIIVVKSNKESTNIYLDELKISGYDINFSKEKFEYTITIKNENKLDIMVFSEAGYNTEIIGNEDLKDGSIIKIIVTDDDGNSNIYKIKIEVDTIEETRKSKDDINYIPAIMTSLLVILFILDTILLVKRINNK